MLIFFFALCFASYSKAVQAHFRCTYFLQCHNTATGYLQADVLGRHFSVVFCGPGWLGCLWATLPGLRLLPSDSFGVVATVQLFDRVCPFCGHETTSRSTRVQTRSERESPTLLRTFFLTLWCENNCHDQIRNVDTTRLVTWLVSNAHSLLPFWFCATYEASAVYVQTEVYIALRGLL